MLETHRYVRKPFHIDAVQVSDTNIEELARWCGGDVRTDSDNKRYVKVRVHRPLNDRQTKAYIGDWVLYAGTGYKVYTTKAFSASFEQASVESTYHYPEDKTEEKVEEKVNVPKKAPKTVTKSSPKPAPPVVPEQPSGE